MAIDLPKIYPITDKRLTGLSHAEQVARLIDGGATLIQLRDKESSPREFLKEARAALQVARRHGARLIINDRLDIALAIGADGVHVGQTDLAADVARRLLGPDLIVGVSTHNHFQLQAAAELPVTYIAFGPIFETATKADHDAIVGLNYLGRAKETLKDKPLVAIGGITSDDIHKVLSAGADSVALISALLAEPLKITEKMRHLAEANV